MFFFKIMMRLKKRKFYSVGKLLIVLFFIRIVFCSNFIMLCILEVKKVVRVIRVNFIDILI